MKTITVKASKQYDILIENGLIDKAGEKIRAVTTATKALIVSDSNVFPLYGTEVENSLKANGFKASHYVFPAGEGSKTPENMISIVEACAEEGLTGGDILIALGGGVVGDITGLSAALYRRGIDFVQIPTTLLAAVDSSVGGKTAVNLKNGKNLMGTFYQPSLVICDPKTMDTLSAEDFNDGCAEVIKYALLRGGRLIELVEKGIKENAEEVIEICIDIKRASVEQDEFDKGERKLLNLGHTVGHAIEKAGGFSATHGSAVSAGMCIIARACAKKGLCKKDLPQRLTSICEKYHLPTDSAYSYEILFSAACSDKKRDGDELTLILPQDFGDCIMKKIPISDLMDYIVLGKE